MKIYAEDEKGTKLEIKEIDLAGTGDILLVQMKLPISREFERIFERRLRRKTGKTVVIIPHFLQIIGTIDSGPDEITFPNYILRGNLEDSK